MDAFYEEDERIVGSRPVALRRSALTRPGAFVRS